MIAIVVLIPLSLMDTHYKRKGEHEQKKGLNKQIDHLRDDNKASAKEFANSFSILCAKFSDLQAKVETGQLLKIDPNLAKEISETKKQLTQAEEKLNQPQGSSDGDLFGTAPDASTYNFNIDPKSEADSGHNRNGERFRYQCAER